VPGAPYPISPLLHPARRRICDRYHRDLLPSMDSDNTRGRTWTRRGPGQKERSGTKGTGRLERHSRDHESSKKSVFNDTVSTASVICVTSYPVIWLLVGSFTSLCGSPYRTSPPPPPPTRAGFWTECRCSLEPCRVFF
jgi:hypothetical protein